MSKIARIAHNAVAAKIKEASTDLKLLMNDILSYKVAGSEYMSAGDWDGRSTFFDYDSATFPAGFVRLVKMKLEKLGYRVIVKSLPAPEPLGPEKPIIDSFPEDPRYHYQMQTVDRLVSLRQMIAQVATGGGKSRIARLAYARIQRPTMFLTTRGLLMHQMADAFKGDGLDVGYMGDGIWSPKKGMNVAMVQTLAARLSDPDPEWDSEKVDAHLKRREETVRVLQCMEFVILEEAHESSGESFFNIMKLCKNAHYRLALTATPFMKSNECDNMRLMASSGIIGIKVSEEYLINCGILAKPYFQFINSKAPKEVRSGSGYQRAYKLGIVHNEFRNNDIVDKAISGVRQGLPVMILVQRKDHGKILSQKLTELGIDSDFIYSQHNQEQRKARLAKLAGGNFVLIGTTIWDVGVDVPAVGMVILAGGGKAEVANRQRIGRGLRAKKKGANICFVVDFVDRFNKHLRDHARERRAIVEETPGFCEGIVDEFDFSLLKEAA